MNRYHYVLKIYLLEQIDNVMFWVCIIGPIFFALLEVYALPHAIRSLNEIFSYHIDVFHYAGAFDSFIAIFTAMNVGYAGVLVMLDERDTGIAPYLCITPLGIRGYIITRIGIPVLCSIVFIFILIGLFNLSNPELLSLVVYALCAGAFGMNAALIVFTFAKNRIEGIAMTKIVNIFIFALPAGVLLSGYVSLPFLWIPTFWIGRYAMSLQLSDAAMSLLCSCLWTMVLSRRLHTFNS
ncbi:hypothetical protein [Stomatohabitans albus]|uniref:hypothetical protein n=1 Tax=Stomatohabitans albus TaxID=3110766 RepID=UPI00300C7CEE